MIQTFEKMEIWMVEEFSKKNLIYGRIEDMGKRFDATILPWWALEKVVLADTERKIRPQSLYLLKKWISR